MNDLEWISTLTDSFILDVPTQSPSEWCCENLTFDEPKNTGRFTLAAREYIREALDAVANPLITDMVLVFGVQTGKTTVIMGALCWAIVNDPPCCMWVMPSISKVSEVSSTRLMPLLRRSEGTKHLIPTGAGRHAFKTKQYQIGSAVVIFTGSNSPSNVSSTPCSMVIQDEMEKFDPKARGEAGTSKLADDRVKNCPTPKRIKTSSPALSDGQIWEALMTTDLRRRYVPCPHCQKEILLVWSKAFTVFDLTGCEAFIRWDAEAERPNRKGLDKWDLERVEKSAAFVCPFCGGRILDCHKTLMDRNGKWRPTREAAPGRAGWHLPSMYASSVEMSFGKLAVQFLTEKHSLEGCKNFINSVLAEPYNAQDTVGERIELVKAAIDVKDDKSLKLMTVDCQANAPYFWYVVRTWTPEETQTIDAGSLDTWEDVRAKQVSHGIKDSCVAVDSGYGAMSDAEVYRNCARFCQIQTRPLKCPLLLGWLPSKGMPGHKKWLNDQGVEQPWTLRDIDPFMGTANAGLGVALLLEFASDYMKDILDTMRKNKEVIKIRWSVASDRGINMEVYWKHMDGEFKNPGYKSRTGTTWNWEKRGSRWPNHLLDCEVMQIALANCLGLIEFK
jgi:phage terminase large subunit GpA-like protein